MGGPGSEAEAGDVHSTSLVPRLPPSLCRGSGNEAPFLVGSRILLEVSIAVLKANNFRGSVLYSDD